MALSGNFKTDLPGSMMLDADPGMDHYWQVVKRHWFAALMTCFSVTALVVAYGLRQVPTYRAESKLRFQNQDSAALTELSNELSSLRGGGISDDLIATEIGIIRSTPIVQETIRELNLTTEEGQLLPPRALLGNLEITNERGTRLLTVAYQAPEAETAVQIVNKLVEVYLRKQLEANRAEASAARKFIETELPAAEGRVRAAEAALRDFKERNQIVAFEQSAQATAGSIDNLEKQMTDVVAKLVDTDAQLATLQARLEQEAQTALSATSLSQSAGVQEALQAFRQAEIELAEARTRYTDNHPIINQLQTNRESLLQVLEDRMAEVTGEDTAAATASLDMGSVETGLVQEYLRLETLRQGLAEQAQVLQNAQSIYQQRAQQLPQLEQEYRELQRQLEATQSTYTVLLQRLQEVRVAENRNVGNVRIIQPAEVLGGAITPSKQRYALMGMALGSLLGVAAALLCDRLDQSIKTVEQAQTQFGLPILGVIPSFGKPQRDNPRRDEDRRLIPALVINKSASLAREAYHLLRSNLRFLDSDYPPRVILITSSLPREGKSTVASNLAAAMAQSGERVLLIDADLHSPIQHWIWEQPNLKGLSNLLVGQASLSEAVIPVMPNLDVLFAGLLPPNPAALFDSKRMTTLLGKFKDQYDFVFLDTPSLSSGATAAVLGKLVDGVLLVVRPGIANQQSASYAKTLIDQSRQAMLGLVVNGAIAHNEPYGQYLSEEFFEDRSGELRGVDSDGNQPLSESHSPALDPGSSNGFWPTFTKKK